MLKYVVLFLVALGVLSYVSTIEAPTLSLIPRRQAPSLVVVEKVVEVVPAVAREVEVSQTLSLREGSEASSYALVRSLGALPRYVKFLSYDAYGGDGWGLAPGGEVVLDVTYRVRNSSRAGCLDVYVEASSAGRSFMKASFTTCYAGPTDYALISYGGDVKFTLGNLTLLPLPPDLLMVVEPGEVVEPSAWASTVLTSVIPVPRGGVLRGRVHVDEGLRYVAFEGGGFSEVLLRSSGSYLRELVLRGLRVSACAKGYRGGGGGGVEEFAREVFKAACRGGRVPTLSEVVERLERMVRLRTEYGSVDLSPYTASCNDMVASFLLYAGRGVCTHYASALALGLRVLNVNSRIAVGLVMSGVGRVGNVTRGMYGLHS